MNPEVCLALAKLIEKKHDKYLASIPKPARDLLWDAAMELRKQHHLLSKETP